MNSKVCIIGTASTMNRTPWDDKSFDLWACSPVPTYPDLKDKNYSLLFELHDDNYYMQPPVLKRLNETTCPIMMKQKVSSIAKSEKFPIDEVYKYFEYLGKGKKYFTSTISFMIAYAIMKEYKEIHLFGVHMSASEEYGSQRQACEYWLGVAGGLGIQVYLPQESEILHTPYVYGYELENDVVSQARIRRLGLLEGVKVYEDKKTEKLIELNQKLGSYKALKKYEKKEKETLEQLLVEIEQAKEEIKNFQTQIDKNLGAVAENEHYIRRYSYSGKLESKELEKVG